MFQKHLTFTLARDTALLRVQENPKEASRYIQDHILELKNDWISRNVCNKYNPLRKKEYMTTPTYSN